MVNHDNIEDYIIDFVSDELSEAEIMEMNTFLAENPQYNSLLDEYQSTIITEDCMPEIEYAHTESLKRNDDVVPQMKGKSKWPYYTLGIAALIGGAAILMNMSDSKPVDVATEDIKKSSATLSKTPPASVQATVKSQDAVVNIDSEKKERHTADQATENKSRDVSSNDEKVNSNTAISEMKSSAKMIETIDPLYFTPRVKQQTLVVHTELITPDQLPKYNTNTAQNEIEFSIAGQVVDINLESLQDIKNKIEDVKQTIHNKVEEASADPISLWDIIKK